ncbi:MAG TPA: hypothetical protein VFJ09_13645 [Nocardioidaceae bacterium]|nr:hypothetical protein [Nocardioidaceae bacterium]
MPRRVSLPSADDLFRPTAAPEGPESAPAGEQPAQSPSAQPARLSATEAEQEKEPAAERSSGRVRHDEKMTVYVTADELLELEHARLALRRVHGVAVDRGRLVREAVAIALSDLEARGEDSVIVRRLTGS